MKKTLCDSSFPHACALLEGIATGTKDLIVALDSNFRCLFLNDAFRREVKNLWGRDIELGTSMMEALETWPEEQQKAIDLWRAALDGESFSLFWETGPPEREKQLYDMHLYPVYDSDGGQIGAAQIMRNITERVRIEQALRESEKRFRCLFENASEGILQIDAELRIIDANDRMAQMLGCPEQEIIGQDLSKFIAPEEFSDLQKRLDNRRQGIKENFERKMVRKDGSAIWMSVSASQLLDDQGNYIGSFGLHTDITERKQAEEVLRREAQILAQVHDSVIATDLEGTITLWNKGAELMYGYSSDEMLGQPASLIYFDEDRPSLREKMIEMRSIGSQEADVRVRTKAGQPKFIHLSLSVLNDENGSPIGIIGYALDITERKKAEERLAKSEEKYRAVFEQAAVGMGRVSFSNMQWIDVNDAFCHMLGYSREEMKKTPWPEITHPADLDLDLIPFRRMADGELDSYSVEKRFIHKKGQHVWARLTLSLVRDSQGKPDYEVAIIENISERKQAERELQESRARYKMAKESAEKANRAKSEFLANMSHEIRTPMTIFLGSIEHLRQLNPAQKHWKWLEMADKSALRLRSLIDDILDFSRIEARQLEIRQESICLSSCIREALNLLEVPAREKDLELKFKLGSEVPETMIGDQNRLTQVLVNLINNAIKFTERGKVEVSAQVDNQNLLFKIRDTGIGIPKEKQHLLFHSFSQIDGAGSHKKTGTGLGLAICKGLVELMGGDIWVESCPGEGSTFSFRIPLNISERSTPSVKGRGPEPEVKKVPSHILLVEDEHMLGNMIYMILKQRGHRIEMVENGREAVARWQEDSFDLILMDMQMPEMNGVEATRVIRNLEKEKGVNPTRIIALSADVRKETQEECKAVGMDGFLNKPINFEELFSAVEQ